jgi:hypothetical protein
MLKWKVNGWRADLRDVQTAESLLSCSYSVRSNVCILRSALNARILLFLH